MLSLATNDSLWPFSLVYHINVDDSVGFSFGVSVSFGWVSGVCGGDSCWFYYITCKGGRRFCFRNALLKCIVGGGG